MTVASNARIDTKRLVTVIVTLRTRSPSTSFDEPVVSFCDNKLNVRHLIDIKIVHTKLWDPFNSCSIKYRAKYLLIQSHTARKSIFATTACLAMSKKIEAHDKQ